MSDSSYKKMPYDKSSTRVMYVSPLKALPIVLVTAAIFVVCILGFIYFIRTRFNPFFAVPLLLISIAAAIIFFYVFAFGFTNKPFFIMTNAFIVIDPNTADRARIEMRDIQSFKLIEVPVLGPIRLKFMSLKVRDIPHYRDLISPRRQKFLDKFKDYGVQPFNIPWFALSGRDQDYAKLHLELESGDKAEASGKKKGKRNKK